MDNKGRKITQKESEPCECWAGNPVGVGEHKFTLMRTCISHVLNMSRVGE